MPNKAFSSISLGAEMKEWFRIRCNNEGWTYDEGMEDYKLKCVMLDYHKKVELAEFKAKARKKEGIA